ncbi:hypothetical protein AB6A40_002663 [Gnathostoma spinigerum]|uniref:Mediator of RNA polymerase II transcription subunit 29 n=1 Tax=Gnathostoma spinigerum TaxID=75299 RepID=A0ABD6ECS6_9BILA
MYGQHQSVPRAMSGGQLNAMVSMPNMMMSSSQPHMMNPQTTVMVSQSGYQQGIMIGQPTMMTSGGSQPHMGQPMAQGMMSMSGPHMSSNMVPTSHMGINTSQHQPMGNTGQPIQLNTQQVYMTHQQPQVMASSQPMFTVGVPTQPRSPMVNVNPGGPPSTGPPSNNPQTPINPASINPPSQQPVNTPATPQQAPLSVQSQAAIDVSTCSPSTQPTDPVALAKSLILRDLRHSLLDLNRKGAELIRPSSSRQQHQVDAASTSHNPLSVNPQSVNPQSVNPLSVNPSSVKSLDEPKSVDSPDKKIVLSPKDAYLNSMNNFIAICDQIEMNLVLIQESQRQCNRFDKMFTGEVKNYTSSAQGYIEHTGSIRGAIDRTLHNLSSMLEKVRAAENQSHEQSSNIKMEIPDVSCEAQGHDAMDMY